MVIIFMASAVAFASVVNLNASASAAISTLLASASAAIIVAFFSASACMIFCCASYWIITRIFLAFNASCSAVTFASMASEKALLNWKSTKFTVCTFIPYGWRDSRSFSVSF